ncbi:MAG: AI-2E family transporter, partial [Rikenellaceae bacterium]
MNTIYKYIITGTITVISLFLMWYFSDILFYILISAVLSLIGKPLVDLLSKVKIYKFGFPKWLSATITLSTMWGVAILLLWFLVPIIIDKLNFISNLDIPEIIAGFNSKVDNLDQFLSNVFSIDFSETDIFNSIGAKITEYITPTLIGLRSIVDKTVILIIGAFSVSFITFFFLKESELFKEGVKMLFPHKHEDSADRSITSSINLLSRYFIGLLIESTIKLIVIAVLLTFVVGL